MSAPGSFTLDPVSPENRPTPVPPRHLKHQIYKDPSVFKPVDDHAVNEARTNYRSFRDLMYHLLFKKHFNQLEKARVIFRWMTTKNMYTIMFDSELPGSPEQVIGGFKDGKTTYARIFECLCSFAGLHCVTISGWAKGVDYRPGAPITSTPVNHSWNAVYIDGNWQLVDSHWATRYLQSERNTPENLVYEYDDFYFIPEPAHLIYSHCPEDPIWQLVHPARSRSEYEEYPLVKSFFFSVGMEFLLQNRGVVYTKNGLFTLTLGFTRPTAFTFRLGYGDKMQESLQGIQLKRYIMQETTDNRVTFYFRAPREGNYYMTVFAQPVGERIRVENVFKAACEYKIVCNSAAGDNRPYPQTSDANWGPGAPVKQYGLIPSHNTAIVDAPNGKAEVSFTKTRPVRVYARLAKDGMDEDTLERSVTVREQDNQIFVTAHLPTRGEYGLEIYANEPDREGDTFTHMCQYLCAYIERDFGTQYGQVYDRSDLTSSMQAAPVGYGMAPTEYAGKPGDVARTKPPGKQVYSTSSQDWDGNTFTQRTYREETETADDGVKSYRQQSQGSELKKPGPPVMEKVTSRMETVTIGGKKAPPPTAPKPAGYPGYDQEDFPPPPPELMDQTYNQQRKGAVHDDLPPPPPEATAGQGPDGMYKLPPSEVPKKPPVEIVYVPIGKSPKTERKEQDEAKKEKPIEVVYVGGNKGSPSMFRKGGAGEGASPQGSPGSARRAQDLSAQEKHHREADDQRPEHGGKLEDVPAYQSRGPGGEQFPPPPPPPGGDQGTRYIPVQVQDQSKRPYGEQPTAQRETTVPVYHEKYPFGGGGSGQAPLVYESQLHREPEQEYMPHAAKVYSSSITIAPPSNFEPQPISREEAAPKPAPPAVPPKPFKDTKIFQNVDTHAVEVSKEEHKSFRDLVWHLIYARNITNELEKARAIFLWLCSKDLTKLSFENIPKGSPEEILMSLKQGQTTYAVVYETLCSYAELHCKTVSGYAKGAEYKPGMKFTGEQGQHSWNAVLVNGAWRLVDCHWAARRLVGKKVTADNVRYELDEYYFMPDPHQLIFTHFPDDTNWQLVERRITLTDFENLVPVKSAFFKYGLQILSHREAVIRTDREVTVRVGSPPMMSQNLAFTFTLSYDDGREEFQGTKLNRFGMQEFVDNVSFFTIRPPEKGSYRLIIYAKDLTQQTKEGVYGGVCEYEVICEKSPAQPQPFPPCVHTSWGPGDSVAKYNLTPMQKGAIFSTVNGLAEVRFRLPKELRFTAKLKSNDKDEKALGGYIMHRVVGDLAIFTINPPYKGEFGLEIYANDSEVDGNSLYHAYQYLIICTDIKGPVEALPALPPGYLGPQPTFKKLGLSADTHTDPYIQTDNGDLQVSFSTDKPLRLTSQLIYVTGGKNEEFSDYVLQQARGNAITFMVKLPKTGLYKFQIYALPYTDTSESLPGVYNYLVNCHNTFATLIPFPKQYGQWKEGCYLFEPLEGTLQANRPSKGSASSYQYIYFKVDVSKAKAVAVVVGEDWTQLEQKPSGTWEGEVFMEKHWGQESKAALCANYGSVKASYSTLLEYTM